CLRVTRDQTYPSLSRGPACGTFAESQVPHEETNGNGYCRPTEYCAVGFAATVLVSERLNDVPADEQRKQEHPRVENPS
ncbi:hypothetical protein, partial [Staphylococcus aureus]|uniref:hypothetical protein n=2 Tax=Staphylococcus aureus TaxID=1280 RepID=UPI0038B29374